MGSLLPFFDVLVSIHAPVIGATGVGFMVGIKYVKFQSTRP